MRALSLAVTVGLLMGLILLGSGSVRAADSTLPSPDDTPKATPTKAAPASATASATADQQGHFEKDLIAAEAKWTDLQGQEMTMATNMMSAQLKANQLLPNTDKIAETFAKGPITGPMTQYRQIIDQCGTMYATLDKDFAVLLKTAKGLEKDKAAAPEDQKVRLEELTTKVTAKHRSTLEKMAELYERVAEWKMALQADVAIMQMIPEKDRAKEKVLLMKIGDLYMRLGDAKSAFATYKILWDAEANDVRLKDQQLCNKMVDALKKMNDNADALAILKARLDYVGGKEKEDVQKQIADLQKKTPATAGNPAAATPAAAAGKKPTWGQ